MGIIGRKYLDVLIPEEAAFMQQALHAFVDNEIMPVRQKIDYDDEHKLVDKIRQGLTDLGIQKAMFPEKYGGMGITSMVLSFIAFEEIARGDVAIAISTGCTPWCFAPAILASNEAVLDRFAPQFCGDELQTGCFAMTEPASGCDIENPEMHGRTIKTIAKLDGDEWVINGNKCLASNSGVSQAYCVVCTTDPNLGDGGIALMYVPYPIEGMSFGKFEDKAGMRADRNCDVFLDNVRVPREYRVAGPGKDAELFTFNVIMGRGGAAGFSIGAAQGAFEKVLEYTTDRIVAGKPIREHSVCACILADMVIGIETARAYYMNLAYMIDESRIVDTIGSKGLDPQLASFFLSRASLAKVYADDVAVMVTNKAMELMGSYGYLHDYDVEKYWRDSKECQLYEGGAQLGRLDIIRNY
ncbi:MAG: acyl-CoA dehydrogenase family protein [Dehalococcoidales bacterium]|nr:acyl-CoA dehydrogenase family protein [Dehalococcoidales bacterium]